MRQHIKTFVSSGSSRKWERGDGSPSAMPHPATRGIAARTLEKMARATSSLGGSISGRLERGRNNPNVPRHRRRAAKHRPSSKINFGINFNIKFNTSSSSSFCFNRLPWSTAQNVTNAEDTTGTATTGCPTRASTTCCELPLRTERLLVFSKSQEGCFEFAADC